LLQRVVSGGQSLSLEDEFEQLDREFEDCFRERSVRSPILGNGIAAAETSAFIGLKAALLSVCV
jgi:hypothetical protein